MNKRKKTYIWNIKSYEVILDYEDYKRLNIYKYHVHTPKREKKYFSRCLFIQGKVKTRLLHHDIMNFTYDKKEKREIDHINGNTLDNRKCNLRIVSHYENSLNRAGNKNSLSKYKGVTFYKDKKKKRFGAKIYNKGKGVFLGYYETEKEAMIAYNRAVKKYHGVYGYFNAWNGPSDRISEYLALKVSKESTGKEDRT